jgi:hypothetical protein
MFRALLSLTILALLGCSPNQSILQDKGPANPSPVSPTETPQPEVRKFTVAQLMERVAKAPPDSFLFPCTLNAYSNEGRLTLLKLREKWFAKEQDTRYLIAPSTGCVCPSVCVLLLEDTQDPVNGGRVLVLDGDSGEKYYWLARNLDLSRLSLSWTDSVPKLTIKNASGNEEKICSVSSPGSSTKYSLSCEDTSGKPATLAQ